MATDRANPPTNFVGEGLNIVMQEYGARDTDLAVFLDTTSSAVGRWRRNANGIKYELAVKMAFIFGCSLDDMTHPKKFVKPPSSPEPDMEKFAREILQEAPRCRHNELRTDAIKHAHKLLRKLEGSKNPVMRERMVEALKGADAANAEPLSRCDRGSPAAPSEREQIRMFLDQANTFSANNNLKWFVHPDGSLGAKRVTVEEF